MSRIAAIVVAGTVLAVEARAASPKQAQQQNADAMASVQQRIVKAGINRDAVRTTGYSIQQEFDFANGRRAPRGYVAHNGVEVRVDAIDRVGELLDAFVDAMASGAGRNVDRVIRITDAVQPRFRMVETMATQRSAVGGAEPTPIEAGLIEIHAQVELTVSIR